MPRVPYMVTWAKTRLHFLIDKSAMPQEKGRD